MIKLETTTTKFRSHTITEARAMVKNTIFRLYIAEEKDGKVTII